MKKLQASAYTIELGPIQDSGIEEFISNHYKDAKIVIMVDENTHDYCLEYLLTTFEFLQEAEVMLLPAGEENKVLEVCFQVWEALSDYEVGRNDMIINVGGGVVTDMGGFIASVFKRGIDFINIPTSLLGMVDAAIGGKTGIDLGPYKNQIGVFNHPKKIYVDPIFLATLPEEELMNGYAEMLKHALITSKDRWNKLKKLESIDELSDLNLIQESVEAKFEVVELDPQEKDVRKKLNLGHTVGHGIEGYLLNKTPISHGHAVAIGLVAEAYISMRKNLLSRDEYFDIEINITDKFNILLFDEEDITRIIEICQNDKKNKDGKILAALLLNIGEVETDIEITKEEINEALLYLNKFGFSAN